MNKYPILSVIVPVRDTPLEYLKECLISVLNQSSKDLIELIIVESNSMPNYKVKLKHLIDKINFDIPVKLAFLNTDYNLPKARNYGVNIASGEYVLFLDSDDILDPYIVEKSIQNFNSDVVLIYTNHVLISEDRNLIIQERDKSIYQNLQKRFKGTIFDPLLHCTYIFHCQIIKRDSFLKLGGFRTDLGYGDEVDLHIKLSELSKEVNFILIPENLYFYRKNPYSIVHQPELYELLIKNIERIYIDAMQRRGFDVQSAKRLGRANPTNAAHYLFFDSRNMVIELPYFDYEKCSIKPEYML